MGITKTQIFDSKQNRLASIFKVMAHPARIAILQYVSTQPSCICNDIVEEIGLAQPTISQHLKELKSIEVRNTILTEVFDTQSNIVQISSKGKTKNLLLRSGRPIGSLNF